MALLLLIITITFIFIGKRRHRHYEKTKKKDIYMYGEEDPGYFWWISAFLIGVCSLCALAVGIGRSANLITIDERITVIEEANGQIERQIGDAVNVYLEHEGETLSNVADATAMVLSIPQLSSSQVVSDQLNTLKSNNDELKQLKLERAMNRDWSWWICFVVL